MRRAVRFATALVVALGLVASVGSAIVHRTLHDGMNLVRMGSMRAFLADFNVYRWAGRMLADAARLRSRDRLTGQLTDHLAATAH